MYIFIKGVLEEILEVEVIIEYFKDREYGYYVMFIVFNFVKVFKKLFLVIVEELVFKISIYEKI